MSAGATCSLIAVVYIDLDINNGVKGRLIIYRKGAAEFFITLAYHLGIYASFLHNILFDHKRNPKIATVQFCSPPNDLSNFVPPHNLKLKVSKQTPQNINNSGVRNFDKSKNFHPPNDSPKLFCIT